MNNTLLIVVALVVAYVLYERELVAAPNYSLGVGPSTGGPNGPPPAGWTGMPTTPQTTGGTPGNSEQNVAHGLEGLVGSVGGAAVCTYYGAGVAAPLCAKVGGVLAPTAVKVGNVTTIATLKVGAFTTNLGGTALTRVTGLASGGASAVANVADTTFDATDKLPTPLAVAAKGALLPVKITADVGAKAASVVATGGKDLASGAKAATSAVVSGAKKVLGFL